MSEITITLAGSEVKAKFSGSNAWLRNDMKFSKQMEYGVNGKGLMTAAMQPAWATTRRKN